MASQDQRPRFVPTDIPVRTLPDFLEPDPPSPVFLAEHIYNRFRQAIHVIDPFDQTAVANCFTSAYGRSPVRSGSYLHHDGRVRYFSPREILRLLGFPASFQIPSDVTPETAWRLVGNSLSVDVTADVVRSLIS
jgi:site-specific DNA-cytosine methylase